MRPGRCGNDPRSQLGDSDRTVVDAFRRYLELAHRRDNGGELTEAEATLVADMERTPTEGASE